MSQPRSDTEDESANPTTSEGTWSDTHSHVSLELDRDGCDLLDPLSDSSEDFPDFSSQFGVTSFHQDLRYTPHPGEPELLHEPVEGVTSRDNSVYLSPTSSPNNSSNNSNDTVINFDTPRSNMAPQTTVEKYIKTYKKSCLIWEDQFAPFEPAEILPFQVTETIRDLDKLLVELREVALYFDQTPCDDFTPDMTAKTNDLRARAINFKKGIMRGANTQSQASPSTSDTAKRIAQHTFASVEPALTAGCDALKKDAEDFCQNNVTTTAQLKKLEAEGDILVEDLTDAIEQWEGLKKDAVTASDEASAMICVSKIASLTKEKKDVTRFVRKKCSDLGCLPGTAGEASAAAAISAPKFSGNLTDKMDYFTFAARLEEYFETTGAFSHAMKFIKLKNDCVTGQAAAAVKITETYDEAMDELKKLFGQPRLLFSAKAAEIKKLGRCPDPPLETRTWALDISNILRHLAKLATDHKLTAMFEGANIVEAVESNMKYRDLNKFKDVLKEKKTHDATFSLEDRQKRVSYLIDFFDTMVDAATFEVDFTMTRSNKACETLVTAGKGRVGKPETTKQASKQYHVRTRDSSEESCGGSPPPPTRPTKQPAKNQAAGGNNKKPKNKKQNNKKPKQDEVPTPVYSNKSHNAKSMDCKLCRMKHAYVTYCHVFQKSLMKDRWKLICVTKTCPRCLRLDAGFTPDNREQWYKEHKEFCTDQFLCEKDECKDRPAHLRNNFTLCSKHREQNRDLHDKFVKQLDQNLVSSEMRFFLNYDPVFPESEAVTMNFANCPDESNVVVEPDPMSPACYMLQTVAAPNGQPMLVFYDTGCYAAAMNERAYSLLATKTVRPGPTWLEVASGERIKIEHGDEQIRLELDVSGPQRHLATITALRMDEVSGKFPLWPLTEAFDQIQSQYTKDFPAAPPLPAVDQQIGNQTVDLMFGMRYYRYFPKLLYMLPSGLSVHRAAFKGCGGRQGVLGGSSDLWRSAMQTAHNLGPAAYLVSELRAYRYQCNTLRQNFGPIHATNTNNDVSVSARADKAETAMELTFAAAPSTMIKEWMLIEEACGNIEYRCGKCRNCSDCKNAEIIEKVSLQEESEQYLMEQCVSLDRQKNQVIAKLPFIQNPDVKLADNYYVAKKILQNQVRIANKTPEGVSQVVASHNKLAEKGFTVAVEDLPAALQRKVRQDGYYIPWRTVSSSSLSTPVRMVFDASSRTSTGCSLNDTLAKGINMLSNMIKLLVQFRIGAAAFAADVSMAYNCIKLDDDFLRYHKYLWVENLSSDETIQERVINTIIYGVKSSGNLTMIGFDRVADAADEDEELAATQGPECLRSSAYLDDIFTSFFNALLRSLAIGGLDKTLELGSMNVKAYTLSGEPPPEKVTSDGIHISLVGYLWDSERDVLKLDIKPLFFGKKHRGKMPAPVLGDVKSQLAPRFTRREIAGKVAGVYDPLGLAVPVTAKLKLDLRELVKISGGWDDLIDPQHLDLWVDNLAAIQGLAAFEIPRAPEPSPLGYENSVELVVATDASQNIAVAVVYARIQYSETEFKCQLVGARSKLVSKMTVPRAELRACVMGACFADVVRRSYRGLVRRIIYVTDSSVALTWIHTDNRPLQVGVRNAVIQIRRFSDPEDWRHVNTDVNPADLGTRTACVEDICAGSVWQCGYPWMSLPAAEMPLRCVDELNLTAADKTDVAKEIRNGDINGIILHNDISKISERYHFSRYIIDPSAYPWDRFIRKLAVLCRCVEIWRSKGENQFPKFNNKTIPTLLEADFEKAKEYVFKTTTKETLHFNTPDQLKDTAMSGGILRYTGRILDGSPLENPLDTCYDVTALNFAVPVLDRYSPTSYAIMIHAHQKLVHHKGAVSTYRASLDIAFILGGKQLAVEIRRNCHFCKRYKLKFLEAQMGKIHPTQLTVAPAFYSTQIDIFGPVDATSKHFKRRPLKAYGVVMKCPTTLAVSIHAMDSYDTQSFLNAFFRFAATRGLPNKVMIDSGSQLLCAFRNADFSATDVTKTLNGQHGVEVEFDVCTVGQHESHGMVERQIQEVKKLLFAVFRGLKLDFLQLETAFVWASNQLNSVPLCLGNRYRNLEQLDLITPARLLLGRNNQRVLTGVPTVYNPSEYLDINQKIEEAWWAVWKEQKLADLIPAPPKWKEGNPEVAVGDVVAFVRDQSQLGGLSTRLGLVDEIERGRDDVIRRVKIKYKNAGEKEFRYTRRSVRNIAVIHHEADLDLPGKLSLAQQQASVEFTRQNFCRSSAA